MLAAAACVLAVVAGLSAVTFGLHQDLQDSRRAADQVNALLTAPDAQTATASTGTGVRGTVVVSQQLGQLVFLPVGLPDVPKNRTYQLWLLGPGDPRSAGLLAANVERSPVVSGVTDEIDAVGLTVEPEGGSRQPTTTPVLVVRLAQA